MTTRLSLLEYYFGSVLQQSFYCFVSLRIENKPPDSVVFV